MARVDPTLPPWHTACAADELIAPDTISGLLDGDGSLHLTGRRQSVRYVPTISLGQRLDDPTPLAVARSLEAYVGRSIGGTYRNPDRWVWRAGGLGDVALVLRFLERHPLMTPRGALQATALREAIGILRRAHVRGARAPLLPGELERLAGLRRTIPGAGPVDGPLPLPAATLAASDEVFGAWFAGFVAAEGCFETRGGRGHPPAPRFRLTQRVDGLCVLEHIRDRYGIGAVVPVKVGVGSPAHQLVVRRDEDVQRLVDVLRRHPLPAVSPKTWQLDDWVELRAIRRSGRATTGQRGREESLALSIADHKQFRGYRGLCSCPSGPTGDVYALPPNHPPDQRVPHEGRPTTPCPTS